MESCNHGIAKILYSVAHNQPLPLSPQLNGNWNSWRIVPGSQGPNGTQLYNILGLGPSEYATSTNYIPIMTDVAFASVTPIISKNSNMFLSVYTNPSYLPALSKPVIIMKPCTGEVLTTAYSTNAGGCVWSKNAWQAGWYFLHAPAPDSFVFASNSPWGY